MYSTLETGPAQPSGLKRLARRDLPTTPRTPRTVTAPAAEPKPFAWPEVTFATALTWTLRGLKWIVVLAVLGALVGYGYSVLARPKYTAYSDLVVDPANLQVVNNDLYQQSSDQNAQLLDVESKLRVLTSGNVLTSVVTELGLQNDPEFVSGGGMFDLSFLTGPSTESDEARLNTAVEALAKKVTARREERTYVVTVAVSTEVAEKSVKIANALVAAFQAELAKAEAEGATRAADALVDRLSQLKSDVADAEGAVETFKRANGLESSNGELVNSQSMTLLNQRSIDAQQALIAAQSHYAELADPVTGEANANAVQTAAMVALRTQYALVRQQADAAATKFGPLHPNRALVDRQMAGIDQQIAAETARAVQTAKFELEQAKRTVAELDQQANAARASVATDGQSQVELRDLERDAKAKSDVYEAFLTRAREITEQQQLDTTNIRIISPPVLPSTRSWPPRAVVTASAGAFGGVSLGIALALALGFVAAARRPRAQ